MLHYGDVRCGDCEHFSDSGCEEAAEALVLEGWPRAEVCPEDSADAARCPGFCPSGAAARGEEEDRPGRDMARTQAIRNFMSM